MTWFRMPLVVAAVSTIIGLFRRRGPAAIVGRVWAVVVFTIDRMAGRRPQAHIRGEVLEALEPAGADADSATSILWIVLIAGVVASTLNSLPRIVLRRVAHAVRARRRDHAFYPEAAARQDFLSEMVLPNLRHSPAVTSADPHSMFRRWPRGLAYHHQPAESLP